MELIPIIRPTLPSLKSVTETLCKSYESGLVTLGRVVASFEKLSCDYTETRHAVAVSSCTSGLILAYAAMGFQEGAEVIVPSFTFAATVQAVHWNRLTPVYVDCLAGSMALDPDEVEKAISPRTAAICPVTIFGLPPDMDELERISEKHGIPMICDSAQGLGSRYKGRPAGGFGICEVFSLSPTKVITAIEGGLITTNDNELAQKLVRMRDYGKGPDGEDMVLNGLSARMSELHASVGLLSLENAQHLVDSRKRLIMKYRDVAARLPGCRVQEFPEDRSTSGNYFTLLIGSSARADRETVRFRLKAENIESKRYFHPPVHCQTAFRKLPHRVVGDLPNTMASARESLALPLFSHMTEAQLSRVRGVLENVLGSR
ncbi:MAG: DegT/DnrJ/EryC1/StrS family aminotransferase [Desulfomonile tiedjei]|uniref:DegT/DnrJ/EryC1/StrS family aminotransferase n=1 Tax=Desulfomonile tiedjei TaxID=2358 RepID=A0A9D6UZ82_9BACT|nr:DegT/DnrJ/EryC1/StrS family aminotransferase [Desulfomonile tiedjei]